MAYQHRASSRYGIMRGSMIECKPSLVQIPLC